MGPARDPSRGSSPGIGRTRVAPRLHAVTGLLRATWAAVTPRLQSPASNGLRRSSPAIPAFKFVAICWTGEAAHGSVLEDPGVTAQVIDKHIEFSPHIDRVSVVSYSNRVKTKCRSTWW